MKGDIYYLKDHNGHISHKFVVDDDDFCLKGRCYEVITWNVDFTPDEYNFVADVYCKWDACSHWRFYGEYYDPDADEKEPDSYYHLCGGYSFMNHITAMCFVWKLAEQIISKDPWTISTGTVGDINDEYFDHERVKHVVEMALNGCEILKGDET
jgi:hypothetical protein